MFSIFLSFLAYRNTNPPLNSSKKNILRALRILAFFFLFVSILEPIIGGIKRYNIKPIIPVLVDNTRSIKVSGETNPDEKIKRFLNGKAIEELQKEAEIRIIPFSSGLDSFSTQLKFESEGTGIGTALTELRSKLDPDDLLGIVLITDGNNNIGEDPRDLVQEFNVPIYTIGVGVSAKQKDIFIKDIITSEIAYKDKELPLKVIIGSYGYEGLRKNIFLYEGEKKLGSKEVILGGKGELVDVEFNLKPEKEGEIRYRIYIPEEPDEISSLNNSRNISVKVRKSKMKFLAVVDILSFDYAFFKRAVSSNPNWEIDEVLVGKDKTINEEKLPRQADDLSIYDCIFVFGSPRALGDRWGYVQDYIRKGGSFFYLALDELKGAPRELKEILPFELNPGDGEIKSDNFNPSVSFEGTYHPMLKIDDGSGRSAERIVSSMPPLEKIIFVGRLKEGAVSLMVHPAISNMPVITTRRLGSGKLVVITAFPLWRWGFLSSSFNGADKAYKSFVSNIVQWLITKETEGKFSVSTDKKIYKAGEEILVKSTLKDESDNPIEFAYIEAKVKRSKNDSIIITQPLSDEGKGLYKLIIRSLPADSYKVELIAKVGDKEIGQAKTSFFVEEYSVEFDSPGLNEPLLRELSSTTGGKFLYLANADSIKDILPVRKISKVVEFEKSVWNSPIFFVLFLVCLTTEWFIRKRADLL